MNSIDKKNQSIGRRINSKGFSLIEMIVAIFVFSLVMVVVMGTFMNVVDLRKKAKTIEQNTENARFALEQMAKTLRTSSIISNDDTNIQAFDYSQGECIQYKYNDDLNALQAKIGEGDGVLNCDFLPGVYVTMANGVIYSASFEVVKSDEFRRGKVTIALEVCADSNDCTGANKVNIQTTVSLRDYE